MVKLDLDSEKYEKKSGKKRKSGSSLEWKKRGVDHYYYVVVAHEGPPWATTT